MLVVSGTMFI